MTKKFKQVLTMLLAVAILVTGLPAMEAKASYQDEPQLCGVCVTCKHNDHRNSSGFCSECYGDGTGEGPCKENGNAYVPCVLNRDHGNLGSAHSATQLPATCYCTDHKEHNYVYDIGTGEDPWVSHVSYDYFEGELRTNFWKDRQSTFLKMFEVSAKQGKWYVRYEGICEAAGGTPEVPCAPCAPKEEPAEPPTPAEVLRAAEEEALPLAIVEKDKTQVAKDEAGIVPDKSYNLSAYVTTKGFVSALNKIAKANPEAKSVSIFTGKAFTFNKNIVEAINKGGKEVVYYFKHAGHLYSVTVPANVDATKVLEKGGHAGPLYVGKVLGTTKLVK